ncbi:MAG: DegQ family serine endoprotease [Sedimentisphaerales bacterium]|nr:DegQ family serine endoprotease [Sedimentisphaerales bacterium]
MKRKKTIGIWIIVVALAMSIAASPLCAEDGLQTLRQTSKAFTAVAKKVIPAVVSVYVERTVEVRNPYGYGSPFEDEFFQRFFGPRFQRPSEKQIQRGQGSGFIISSDGYILTNNHVAGQSDKIMVTLNDGREFEAKLIGADPKSDIALIKVDGDNLPVIELGDSDSLEIGEWVIAVGNPFRLAQTVTVGVVSAKGRAVGILEDAEGYEDFIQTDAAINPGNSGGPLLNLDGKAIGMNTAIYSQSGGYMGIGFAIPINMAKFIKDQLVNSGKVERGYMGVGPNRFGLTPELAEEFGLKNNHGALIASVIPDSPADKAGLQPDDIVLEYDGKEVRDWNSFRNAVGMTAPGSTVNLVIWREGKKITVKAKIGSFEDVPEVAVVETKLGIQVQELDEKLAREFDYKAGSGVIVAEVEPDSSAYEVGIRPGMLILSVNRKPVGTVKEFNDAISKATDKVLLRIQTEYYTQYVLLPLK